MAFGTKPAQASNYLALAISEFPEAIAEPKSQARKSAEAEALTSIGWAYQSIGNIPKALASYKDAKALFLEVGDQNGRIRTQLAVASLYQSIGEPDKAIDEYKALPTRMPVNQYIRVLVSVGEIMLSRNRPDEALKRYQKALVLAESIVVDPVQEAVILAGMGRCEMVSGRYLDANLQLEKSRAEMQKAGNRAGEAGVVADLGELHYWQAINSPMNEAKRHFALGLDYYNQALPLMREVGDRNGEIGVLANTGLLYDAWRKPNDALNYYLQALSKIEQLQVSARLEDFRIDLAGQAAGLYERAIMLEVSQHSVREAFDLSERARARTFLDQIGAAGSQSGSRAAAEFSAREEQLRKENTLLERQIGQELSKPGPEINSERLHTLQARLAGVRAQYEDAVRDLKIGDPNLASLLTISPLPLPELQKQLEPDLTVVSYFTTWNETLAFVITRTTFDLVKLPVGAPELTKEIATFRDFSGEDGSPATLKQLYKRLVAPLSSHLNAPLLAIVPHGPINELPFAALMPDKDHFLSDKYAVFYLPSASVIAYVRPNHSSGTNPILVMASEGSPGSPRLVNARYEAETVGGMFGVAPLLGDRATAANLRNGAGNARIVHLAAHITIDPRHPRSSSIDTTSTNAEDGSFDLRQVAGLDLRNTNLVVLSGCESQRGGRSRGDDIIGLSRAFMLAGSPSVIASLWSVDDEATRQLMVAFYTHLKAGLSKAEALRAAEAEVRRQHSNPYYWAGFVLMGDPGGAGTLNFLASAAK